MADPRYLLDSRTLIHLLEGHPASLMGRVGDAERGTLAVSSIAYAEVMFGAVRADRAREAEEMFRHFPILAFDTHAAKRYAELPFKRGSFDRLIAAHALALGLPVITSNARDFRDVPGLPVENWAE